MSGTVRMVRKPRALATEPAPTSRAASTTVMRKPRVAWAAEPERLLTFPEAARIARKHPSTIYAWVRSTKLRWTRRADGTLAVREADLRAFLRHLDATKGRSLKPQHRPGEQFSLPLDDDDGAP